MRTKPEANSLRSASGAVSRGNLGMSDFQRRGKNGLAVQSAEFSRLESIQVELRGLAQIGQRLFNRVALSVATFKFRTIGECPILVLFDDRRERARHGVKITVKRK